MVATPRVRRRARTAAALITVVCALALLSSCASETEPTPPPSAPTTGSDTPTPDAPEPSSTPTPVTLACNAVITPEQLYAYNSNVGSDPKYAPAAGSPEATAVAQSGVACGWLNQSSNSTMQFAIARPTPAMLDELGAKAATSSTPVPTYGDAPAVEGFFSVRGDVGEVQVFTGPYWIVGSSRWFLEPGDAAEPMQDILANLKG